MDNSNFPTFRLSLHLSKEDASDQEEHNLPSQVSEPASSAGILDSLDTNLSTSEASHTVLLDLMWQFDPTFRLETSSVTPFINVPPPPSVPGLIRGLQSVTTLPHRLISAPWPGLHSRLDPQGSLYHILLHIRPFKMPHRTDSGPLSALQQNNVLLPFDCSQPADVIDLCFASSIARQIV